MSSDAREVLARGAAAVEVMAALVALGAVLPHGPGYFTFARWVVCGGFAVSAAGMMRRGALTAGLGCFAGALVFNPIVPFYFARGTWCMLDGLAAVVLIVSAKGEVRSK